MESKLIYLLFRSVPSFPVLSSISRPRIPPTVHTKHRPGGAWGLLRGLGLCLHSGVREWAGKDGHLCALRIQCCAQLLAVPVA